MELLDQARSTDKKTNTSKYNYIFRIVTHRYASGDIAREIAIIKKLDQENIVKVIEVLDNPDENRLYVIMDYLPGGSLFPDWDGDGTLDNPLEERDAVILFFDSVSSNFL